MTANLVQFWLELFYNNIINWEGGINDFAVYKSSGINFTLGK